MEPVIRIKRRFHDASRCIVLAIVIAATFAASTQAAPTSITEYPIEVGHPTNIDHIAVGADGTVWFADGYWPEGSFHALIGRLDPADGEVHEFDEGLGSFSVIRDFVATPDGSMWFTDSGSANSDAAIGKITPGGSITEYGGLDPSRPQRMAIGPDGALWFTASNSPAIGRATLGGAIGTYDLPGAVRDVALGPDGNIWFTYGGGSVEPAIGRVERHEDGSALITLFQVGLDTTSKPERMVVSGGYLWFSDISEAEPAIGRVSADGQITEFQAGLAPSSYVVDLEPGPEGNVWFTDYGVGAVGRIDSTGQISEFTAEYLGPDPWLRSEPGRTLQHLVAGPDGNVWFNLSGGWSGIGKVSQSGDITVFLDGQAGLGGDSNPQELAAGSSGELWFVSNTGVNTQSIGRIVPGDDNAPNAPQGTAPGPSATALPGRVVVIGGRTLRLDRYGRVRIRLSCQSLATGCAGTLQLTIFVPEVSGYRQVGSASFSLVPGASRTMWLHLDRRGRGLLAAKHHRRVELSIVPLSDVTMNPLRLRITLPRRRG